MSNPLLPEVVIRTERQGGFDRVVGVEVDGFPLAHIAGLVVTDTPNGVTTVAVTILAGRVTRVPAVDALQDAPTPETMSDHQPDP